MSTLTILIADDHDIVRRGLRAVLGGTPGWSIVSEVVDGLQAVEQAALLQPGVAVLDLSMPKLNGLEAAKRIRAASPNTRIVILTVHTPASIAKEVIACGASALVLKSDASEQLIRAIQMILDGQLFFSGQVSAAVAGAIAGEGAPLQALTAREAAIVRLVAEGRSNKEMAFDLGISIRTVETHRQNVMKKLQIATVSELVRWAVRNDLVEA